jgi:hypothetical protein
MNLNTPFELSKRKEMYCKIAQAVVDEIPELYLFLFQDGYGFNKKLHGYELNTWGTMTWDVQNWWMEE